MAGYDAQEKYPGRSYGHSLDLELTEQKTEAHHQGQYEDVTDYAVENF